MKINIFTNYYYGVSLLISVWILLLAISRIIKSDLNRKKQIIFLTVGIELFSCYFLFYWMDFKLFGGINGILKNYDYEQYGLFGMTIFMAFIGYIIVRFKAFNIKMLATNALVVALVILIGSELFFTDNTTIQILVLVLSRFRSVLDICS